jgi:K+-transporting ATPase KdpF subunit
MAGNHFFTNYLHFPSPSKQHPYILIVIIKKQIGAFYGFYISMPDRDFFRNNLVFYQDSRFSLEVFKMNSFYMIGSIIVIGLIVYLFIALLKPELFT